MTMTSSRWRGTGGRVGLLVLAATLIPLPVAAADSATATSTPTPNTARTSLHQAITREAARAAVQTPMAAGAPTRRENQDSGNGVTHFLKSKPGMIAISVMAIGTGYAIYSVSHDRIKSQGRQ